MGPVVWVEGTIGSGKSTLTAQIAEKIGLRPMYEPVEANPYLEDFYKDPKGYGFLMQIHLLHARYAMQQSASFESVIPGGCFGSVMDRGLPGDRVFAKLLTNSGHITKDEWDTYEYAYNVMACSLRVPSLIVYLDVSPERALERVKKRARGAEVGIELEYLQRLGEGYNELLEEIESGQHAWAQGMSCVKVSWEEDYKSIDPIIEEILKKWPTHARIRKN